ncbi:MAG: hypothetical protein ABH863_01505 [Candidatus Micrarchaeota archaeon]
MNMKAISIVLILLGVAFSTLALSQLNQYVVSNAQSDISKEAVAIQIAANEALAKSYGQTDEEIAQSTKETMGLIDKSAASLSNAYLLGILIDGILGLILLFAGIVTFPSCNKGQGSN